VLKKKLLKMIEKKLVKLIRKLKNLIDNYKHVKSKKFNEEKTKSKQNN